MRNHRYKFLDGVDDREARRLLNFIIGANSITPRELEKLYLDMKNCEISEVRL